MNPHEIETTVTAWKRLQAQAGAHLHEALGQKDPVPELMAAAALDHPDAQNELGWHFRKTDPKRAAAHYRKAVERFLHPGAAINLAGIRIAESKSGEADPALLAEARYLLEIATLQGKVRLRLEARKAAERLDKRAGHMLANSRLWQRQTRDAAAHVQEWIQLKADLSAFGNLAFTTDEESRVERAIVLLNGIERFPPTRQGPDRPGQGIRSLAGLMGQKRLIPSRILHKSPEHYCTHPREFRRMDRFLVPPDPLRAAELLHMERDRKDVQELLHALADLQHGLESQGRPTPFTRPAPMVPAPHGITPRDEMPNRPGGIPAADRGL